MKLPPLRSALSSLGAACLLLALLPAWLQAVHTENLMTDTFSQFSEGEAHAVTLTSDGFVTLGPTCEKWCTLPTSVVWAVLRNAKGGLYVAAGNEGQVFKVTPEGKATEFFKAKELQVQTLATNAKGDLFAGSLPEGKIYQIKEDGTSNVFFTPPEKYIWAMEFDSEGNLFVATGEHGKLYKVSSEGKGEVFYDSDETHLRSLLFDRKKRLWAGSEGSGLVYRFDKTNEAQGSPFVPYDSSLKEIKCMVEDKDGSIFVAAMGSHGNTSLSTITKASAPRLSLAVPPAGNQAPMEAGPKAEEMSFTASETPGASEIVQILPDGTLERRWNDHEDIFCMGIAESGNLWAGTGNKARLLELTVDHQLSVMGQLDAETLTQLLPDGKGGWFAATSSGILWRISDTLARKGFYDSRVLDTHSSSHWGALHCRNTPGEGKIRLLTRSGNTPKADKVWSEWMSLDGESHIRSETSRYIQFRVELEGSGRTTAKLPKIDNVQVFYQPRNRSPEINQVSILPAHIELVKTPKFDGPLPPLNPNMGPGASKGGPKMAANEADEPNMVNFARTPMLQQLKKFGWRSVTWQASDSNNDEMQFDVYYRSAGADHWNVLKQEIRDQFYSWDSAMWPDGDYYIKIVASDVLSNPEVDSRKDETTSPLFCIDHTAPTITVEGLEKTVPKGFILITIHDDVSVIDEAEYSLNGEEWRPLLPKSGIYDARSNEFKIPVDGLKNGDHYVNVRASDSADNVTSQTIRFQKK